MDATLLIADIQSPSRDALEDHLTRCGFRLEGAGDGLDCLAKVRALEPEVLVIDWELPWGGAAAVVAFLNEIHFEFEMPTVLVIGNAPPEVLSERTGVPHSSCFPKPVQMDRLLDEVGLAMAQIDLRTNGEASPSRLRLSHPCEKETCLI
jgi:DNA-binding NtrC family response regulator